MVSSLTQASAAVLTALVLSAFVAMGTSISRSLSSPRSASSMTVSRGVHGSRGKFGTTHVSRVASAVRLHAKSGDKFDDGAVTSTKPPSPMIPRSGQNNYVAKWQSRGDHYVSYDNLQRLDRILSGGSMSSVVGTKSKSQNKKELVSELSLTYFARFHNMIREEYQYEKRVVEDRLRAWPLKRLRREGFVLLDMVAAPKGNLFQEKVFRFSSGYNDKLPFHRFGVGDSVRITVGRYGNPLREDAIDGVVLDRRQKYIDVCLRPQDALQVRVRLCFHASTRALHLIFILGP